MVWPEVRGPQRGNARRTIQKWNETGLLASNFSVSASETESKVSMIQGLSLLAASRLQPLRD